MIIDLQRAGHCAAHSVDNVFNLRDGHVLQVDGVRHADVRATDALHGCIKVVKSGALENCGRDFCRCLSLSASSAAHVTMQQQRQPDILLLSEEAEGQPAGHISTVVALSRYDVQHRHMCERTSTNAMLWPAFLHSDEAICLVNRLDNGAPVQWANYSEVDNFGANTLSRQDLRRLQPFAQLIQTKEQRCRRVGLARSARLMVATRCRAQNSHCYQEQPHCTKS